MPTPSSRQQTVGLLWALSAAVLWGSYSLVGLILSGVLWLRLEG